MVWLSKGAIKKVKMECEGTSSEIYVTLARKKSYYSLTYRNLLIYVELK
jgi:hypothetical protein